MIDNEDILIGLPLAMKLWATPLGVSWALGVKVARWKRNLGA